MRLNGTKEIVEVAEIICDRYNTTFDVIQSGDKRRVINEARQMIMYFSLSYCKCNPKYTGYILNRCQFSVTNGAKSIIDTISIYPEVRVKFKELERIILND